MAHIESWLMAAGCRPQVTRGGTGEGKRNQLSQLSKKPSTRKLRFRSGRLSRRRRAALAVRLRTPLLLSMWALGLALPSTAAAVPEQGIYFNCYRSCEPGLDAAQAAGLRFVIAPPSLSMAAALQARGMSAFWNVPFRAARPELVRALATNPTTRGWYVADEPTWEEGGKARWWTQQIHLLDPVHPTLSVHFGCSWAQAAGAMRPFKDAADWLGTDCYPVGPDSAWQPHRPSPVVPKLRAAIASSSGQSPKPHLGPRCAAKPADVLRPRGLHRAKCRSCVTARPLQKHASSLGTR